MMVKSVKVMLRRAVYGWGNFNTPDMSREYNIVKIGGKVVSNSAVGTIAEVCDFLEGQGYSMVDFEIQDKGKTTLMKGINVKIE